MSLMNESDIGQRVLERRLELGLYRQADAARQAGISTTTWGLLESQNMIPKTARVRRQIAAVLQWAPDALDRASNGIIPPAIPSPEAVRDQALVEAIREVVEEGRREDRELFEKQIEALRKDLANARRAIRERRQ